MAPSQTLGISLDQDIILIETDYQNNLYQEFFHSKEIFVLQEYGGISFSKTK